jgi:hypothetical protein
MIKKYLAQLTVLSGIIALILFLLPKEWHHPYSYFVLIFYLILSISIGFWGSTAHKKEPDMATMHLFSALGAHFFISLLAVSISIVAVLGYDPLFVGIFFLQYIPYTSFVVYSLLTTLRPNSERP